MRLNLDGQNELRPGFNYNFIGVLTWSKNGHDGDEEIDVKAKNLKHAKALILAIAKRDYESGFELNTIYDLNTGISHRYFD